jgi:hypothetical protein
MWLHAPPGKKSAAACLASVHASDSLRLSFLICHFCLLPFFLSLLKVPQQARHGEPT